VLAEVFADAEVFAVVDVVAFAVADLDVVVGAGAVVLLVVADAVGDFVSSELSAEPDGDVSCDLLGDAAGGALVVGGVVVGFGSVLGDVDGELGGVDGELGVVGGLLDVGGELGGVDGLPGVVGCVGGLLVGRGVGLVVGVWLLGVSGSGEPRCGPSTVPSTEP
jgi:hypothetical protein